MPFLELSLRCRAIDEARAEHALEDIGALSVTVLDADAGTSDEHAILEPGVGETPLWPELTVQGLFPADADRGLLLLALEAFDPALDLASVTFREVADQDWVRAWMDDYPPLRFGNALWIVPWNAEVPPEALALGDAATLVRLDPGLAFGSGTHATTALCLEWLESLDLAGKTVLDVGCGSGILAIAALKLGAARAVGIDNDPQAVLASHDNAARNAVDGRIAIALPDDAPEDMYDVVVANILASALDVLADTIAARVKPGGLVALSGILDGQQEPLLARYAAWFDRLAVTRRDDWVRIDGVRKPATA